MKLLSDFFTDKQRLLLAVASAGETNAVLKALMQTQPQTITHPQVGAQESDATEAVPHGTTEDWKAIHLDNFSILQTGVGKANAAGAVSRELTLGAHDNRNYAGVLSFGIAGSLTSDVEIGSTVCASTVSFADEGTPSIQDREWTSLETAGWAQTYFPSEETCWVRYLQDNADHCGVIATVSTISGTDQIAEDYFKRTNAIAEAMEGAAIAQVCLRLGIPFAEFRVISNRCGNRNLHKLDIPTSFKKMREIIKRWAANGSSAEGSCESDPQSGSL
jgi:futalosine hydrolase